MIHEFYADNVPQVMITALIKSGFKVQLENNVRTLSKRFNDDICLRQYLRKLRGNTAVDVSISEDGNISIIKASDNNDFITIAPSDSLRWCDVARQAGVRTPKWIDEVYSLDVNTLNSEGETGYTTLVYNVSLSDAKQVARNTRCLSPTSESVFRILNSKGEIALVSTVNAATPRMKWEKGNMKQRCDSPPISNAVFLKCQCGSAAGKPTYSPLSGYTVKCENHGKCKRMTSSVSSYRLVKNWNRNPT